MVANSGLISSNRVVVNGTQGQPVTLTCTSRGGSPKPTLKWFRTSTNSPALDSTDETKESNGVYNVTIEHTFEADRTDDRQDFICQSSYPTEPEFVEETAVELYLQCKRN